VLPGGVRNNQLQKTPPLVTSLTHEGVVGAAGQLEQLDARVRIAPVGAAVIPHRLRDPVLLRPPLAGLALVEGDADLAVELVDIHLVEPVLELVVLEETGVQALEDFGDILVGLTSGSLRVRFTTKKRTS
jgi:hypothetical protein